MISVEFDWRDRMLFMRLQHNAIRSAGVHRA